MCRSRAWRCSYCALSARNNPHSADTAVGLSLYSFINLWRQALKGFRRGELSGFTISRHSCASYMAQKGVSLQVIGRILGHSAPATTARYSHIEPHQAADALNDMTHNLFPPETH